MPHARQTPYGHYCLSSPIQEVFPLFPLALAVALGCFSTFFTAVCDREGRAPSPHHRAKEAENDARQVQLSALATSAQARVGPISEGRSSPRALRNQPGMEFPGDGPEAQGLEEPGNEWSGQHCPNRSETPALWSSHVCRVRLSQRASDQKWSPSWVQRLEQLCNGLTVI